MTGLFWKPPEQRVGIATVSSERKNPSVSDKIPIATDLNDLGIPGRVDCVTLWHTLEHLEDPVKTLTHLRKTCTPRVVIATVPNFNSWQARFTGPAWMHLDIPRHLYHFTDRSLTETFEAAGFRVTDLNYGELEYDIIGWSQSLLNVAFKGQNEFFAIMSGRFEGRRTLSSHLQFFSGVVLSLLAIAPAWLERRTNRSGTLVVVAQPSPREEGHN